MEWVSCDCHLPARVSRSLDKHTFHISPGQEETQGKDAAPSGPRNTHLFAYTVWLFPSSTVMKRSIALGSVPDSTRHLLFIYHISSN